MAKENSINDTLIQVTGELHHVRALLHTLNVILGAAEDVAQDAAPEGNGGSDFLSNSLYILADARKHVDDALVAGGAL